MSQPPTPLHLPNRSLLLFIDPGFLYLTTLTPDQPTETRISAHQSVLRLICQPLQRDKTMSLTMGSVMEGPAWWGELNQAFLSQSAGH